MEHGHHFHTQDVLLQKQNVGKEKLKELFLAQPKEMSFLKT